MPQPATTTAAKFMKSHHEYESNTSRSLNKKKRNEQEPRPIATPSSGKVNNQTTAPVVLAVASGAKEPFVGREETTTVDSGNQVLLC